MNTDIVHIDNDIHVATFTATSFPEGIQAAHQKLHSIFQDSNQRRSFGVSRPEQDINHIVYKAAVEEAHEDEAAERGCEHWIIPAGSYAAINIHDYQQDLSSIGKAFDMLLEHPHLDPDGFCLEWYESAKDMKCMVPLASKNDI